eukprot:8242892-Pyramimonas_sp.AAC.1
MKFKPNWPVKLQNLTSSRPTGGSDVYVVFPAVQHARHGYTCDSWLHFPALCPSPVCSYSTRGIDSCPVRVLQLSATISVVSLPPQ